MAGGVSVERAAVQGGIGCCKLSMNELERASKELFRSYQNAGSNGWRDQKYMALGGIVQECCGSLIRPMAELQDCMVKLEELLRTIDAYEQVNL